MAIDLNTRFAQLQQHINQNPQNIPALMEMAEIFLHSDNQGNAMQVLSHLLTFSPDYLPACQMMAQLLGQLNPEQYHPQLDTDLLKCWQQEDLDHQILAATTAQHLLNKYQVADTRIIESLSTQIHSLQTDPLFLRFLSRCINIHAFCEQWLTAMRAHLLNNMGSAHSADRDTCNLIAAFGLQAFANEYIWHVSDQEKETIEQLTHSTNNVHLLLTSMYQPLFRGNHCNTVLSHHSAALVEELIQDTLQHTKQEQQLATTIASLSTTESNIISNAVKQQYEENPYPRWRTPPAPQRQPLLNFIHQLPGFDAHNFSASHLDVLVAGCGTGFEPIDLARMDPSLNITALDLSRASLAYGCRIARELHINNIQFIQGDILAVDKLQKQFDVINSTGVLHHMENPEAGWHALCAVIKPGGVMRISLYSELARAKIVAARTFIQKKNISSNNESIKQFRAYLFSLSAQHPLNPLIQSHDFYSTSGCRDLLFHVQEHRFTLLQLKTIIQRLGLRLIGFDAPHYATARFEQQHPHSLLDLEKWHHYEKQHPDTFAGMYQLWLQKM